MDALAFFLLQYSAAHAGMTDQLLDGLTEEQLRCRPHGMNSIAWHFWHMARCEDVGVNRMVIDGSQVFDDEGWERRLRVSRRDIGTGMTDDEVTELSCSVDLVALREYWGAVYRRTLAVLGELRSADLETRLPAAEIARRCEAEGLLGEHAGWVVPMWAGEPNRGWFLLQLALVHHHGHLYQAAVTRGCLGASLR